MNDIKITLIGAGNMASSIIGGLINRGVSAENICASDPNNDNLKNLHATFGIKTNAHNREAVANADVILLAVKPQVMAQVCQELRGTFTADALFISIAAGISCDSLSGQLGSDVPIVRCMPNTPALVGEGASALYANPHVQDEQRRIAQDILAAVGTVCWVTEETLMDTVTAVSGSGPAYFFLFVEAMIDAAIEQGLDSNIAEMLALQTALGSAKLAKSSDVDLIELRRRVTSPNGTTQRAIESFEGNGLRDVVRAAMQACAERSRELAKEMKD